MNTTENQREMMSVDMSTDKIVSETESGNNDNKDELTIPADNAETFLSSNLSKIRLIALIIFNAIAKAASSFVMTATLIFKIISLNFKYNIFSKKYRECRIKLGVCSFESGQASNPLGGKIQVIDDQIESCKAAGGKISNLILERKGILIRLADSVIDTDAVPSTCKEIAIESVGLKKQLADIKKHKEQLAIQLWPSDNRKRISRSIELTTMVLIFGLLLSSFIINFFPPQVKSTIMDNFTIEEIVARSEHSIAQIVGAKSSGTGFVVADGIVITNAHVLENEIISAIKVIFMNEANTRVEYNADLIYYDIKRDLAFLRVAGATPPQLPLERNFNFSRGSEVITIGNPGIGRTLTLQNAVTRGVLSTQTEIDGQIFYQLSMSINPGNSGGPVLNKSGNVIGVATLRARNEEGIAFSVPLSEISEALEVARKSTQDDIAFLNSKHDFRVLFETIHKIGSLYIQRLLLCSDRIHTGVRAGRDITLLVSVRGFTD